MITHLRFRLRGPSDCSVGRFGTRPRPRSHRRNRRHPGPLAVLVVVAAFGLAACGGPTPVGAPATTAAASGQVPQEPEPRPGTPAPRPLPEPATLTVSKSRVPIGLYANVLLAQELGEFAKENLTVEFVSESFVNSLVLMQQSRLDGAVLGLGAGVFNAVAGGADVRFVLPVGAGPVGDTSGFWARKALFDASGRFDPCVLARGVRPGGKTVVSVSDPTGLGGPGAFFLARLVSSCPGQTLEAVVPMLTVSNLVGADLIVALSQGAVDVALLIDPLNRAPGLSDFAQLAQSVIDPGGPQADYLGWAFGPVRHQRPDVVDAFVRASIRTARTHLQGDYLANPTTRAALARVLGVAEEVLLSSRSQVFSLDQRIGEVAVRPLQDVWRAVGDLLDFAGTLDGSSLLDLGPRDRVGRVP